MTTRSTQILVIGAGATGLGVAWDACLRGFQVTVVEQGDLGQGTSGRYHGLLHSGGRYVISDPPSAIACRTENRVLRDIARHTIEPTGGLFLSTPHDPPEYPDRWLEACRAAGVPVRETRPGSVLRREPLITTRLARAFEVEDAALDSFELLHGLARGLVQAGGSLLIRHRLVGLVARPHGMLARVVALTGDATLQIEAALVVNAAGPFAGTIATMAGAHLPVALGKGTMVAMATRLTQTVLNRCKAPHDGDIIVPVGTVCVLGTTDTPVSSPSDLSIEPWEVNLLLSEGQAMIPTLRRHRALRAWAGIRALPRPAGPATETRSLPRSHALIDHAAEDGLPGLVSILGGKLTTFRLMAEEVVDLIQARLGGGRPCTTLHTPLPLESRRFYAVGEKLRHAYAGREDQDPIVCECEMVPRSQLKAALRSSHSPDLDDARRDLRLGMGPCQGAFCSYRAAALAASLLPNAAPDGGLADFVRERWRGLTPLAWGRGLRQIDLLQRIQLELLGAEAPAEGR
jgi:glycerol-3-phosphate dehydrogenase